MRDPKLWNSYGHTIPTEARRVYLKAQFQNYWIYSMFVTAGNHGDMNTINPASKTYRSRYLYLHPLRLPRFAELQDQTIHKNFVKERYPSGKLWTHISTSKNSKLWKRQQIQWKALKWDLMHTVSAFWVYSKCYICLFKFKNPQNFWLPKIYKTVDLGCKYIPMQK